MDQKKLKKSEAERLLPLWISSMQDEEKAVRTINRYKMDVTRFLFSCGDTIEAKDVIQYKAALKEKYKTSSVNLYLVSLNKFFKYIGSEWLCVSRIKEQQATSLDDTLSRSDYERLLRWALRLGKYKAYWIMRTLAGTGIRIEELKFITAESVANRNARVTVENKGKIRDIAISPELAKGLRAYCKKEEIKKGIIFHGRDPEKMIDKSYIWREMKSIAGSARVKKSKVHAHSFRHLFAKSYMELPEANLAELADLLGHSSLETTRIYTRSSGREKRAIVSKLNL